APWLLGGVKSTSYAVNMASLRAASAEGADDAIWLSSDGELLEAPTATVALVTGGRLVTPPDTVGILPGTTVAAVLRLASLPVERRRVTADELAAADEVMLLSSVRGVAPVTVLDGRELGVGPVTAALRDAFEASLHD
ncbi:MAG: aminotransferase class IV, partial [Mycobacteriales bacterium]